MDTVKIDHGATEAIRHGIARSDKWPHVKHAHLATHPHCAACASIAPGAAAPAVQVHHIMPFHYAVALGRPDLELDDRNLITLCETEAGRPGPNHHLLIGHLDDFKSSDLNVTLDATQTFFGMSADAIKTDHRWLALRMAKLKPLDEMTEADKTDFITVMNTRFPKLA